jgi:hypothetical protein
MEKLLEEANKRGNALAGARAVIYIILSCKRVWRDGSMHDRSIRSRGAFELIK